MTSTIEGEHQKEPTGEVAVAVDEWIQDTECTRALHAWTSLPRHQAADRRAAGLYILLPSVVSVAGMVSARLVVVVLVGLTRLTLAPPESFLVVSEVSEVVVVQLSDTCHMMIVDHNVRSIVVQSA